MSYISFIIRGCIKIDMPSFRIQKKQKKQESPNFHKLGLCYFRKNLYLSEN